MDAAKLIDSMSTEQVVAWAVLLQLEYDKPVVDDDYPDREDALRGALVDALNMKLFGVKEELPLGALIRLDALVREAMIRTLYIPQLTLTAAAIAYDDFFNEHTKGDEKYRQRIADYCEKCYNGHHQRIIRLLRKGG